MPSDLVIGADGLARCPWGADPADYRDYHDTEWGRPVRGDRALFERLCLEAFQSGLSWLTILRKRAAFREVFAGFDPAAVAALTSSDVERLMTDARIVRNRRKIEATVVNARALLALQSSGETLTDLVWSHVPEARRRPRAMGEVPSVTMSPAPARCR